MATRPNQPDPSVPGVRRATDRANNKEITVLAADLQTAQSYEFKPDCVTCNGTNAERITIPNSVIMDALLAPADGLDGERLADVVVADERITARTALNPTPHKPQKLGRQHLMARAVDMVNARIIPFSPFGAFVNQDRLRDRAVFAEWTERYLEALPESSTIEPGTAETVTVVESGPDIDGTHREAGDEIPVDELPQADAGDAAIAALDQLDEPEPGDPMDGYPADGDVTEVNAWIGDSNKTRAQYALDVENSKSRPRKTIVTHAETVLAAAPVAE